MERFNRKALGLIFAGLIVIGMAVLIYTYRLRLALVLDLLVQETGSKKAAALCLVGALFILVCALCWMLFPILLYLGLSDLRRRVLALDDATRLCAHQLGRLRDARDLPQSKNS